MRNAALIAAFSSTWTQAQSPTISPDLQARQLDQYEAVENKTVLALQPFRTSQKRQSADGVGLQLVSMHPAANTWFILTVTDPEGRRRSYHLESAKPNELRIYLTEEPDPQLAVTSAKAGDFHCRPWAGDEPELEQATNTGLPYSPICGGRVFVRNEVAGSRTNREAVTEFLRDNVWFGESIIGLIKSTFYQDAYFSTAETSSELDAGQVVAALGTANLEHRPVMAAYMGFDLAGANGGRMEAGSWYAVNNVPDIYASVLQPGMINRDILNAKDGTGALDRVERLADIYLVAFDLERFEMGYELGTEHPRVDWSPRPRGGGRNWDLVGPDGIDQTDPLIRVGMLSPALWGRVAAAFTGGFKRHHGAFKFGEFATFNNGHHYGFISNGVVLSKLQPSLATLYVLMDGTIGMKTWGGADDPPLRDIRHARQNGFPLLHPDPESGQIVPHSHIRQYGRGNWSGSADAEFRTLRSGACLRTVQDRDFLIYGYFSAATPSALVRVFQAYGCHMAMQLDINSQEHTYMALYAKTDDGTGIEAQHLVQGMKLIDTKLRDGTRIPRFVGFSDNRDFLYLLRKEPE